MNRSIFFIFLFFCFQLNAQDSTRVEAYLTDPFFVYPYELRIYSAFNTYTNESNDELLKYVEYIQAENGLIHKNERFQDKDTSEYGENHIRNHYDVLSHFYYEINLDENIPPALDSLPDGKYVRYYAKTAYSDMDTIKFIQGKIASIYYLKNNVPDGPAYWFTFDEQEIYKQGTYKNGKREGNWYFVRKRTYNNYRRTNYVDYDVKRKKSKHEKRSKLNIPPYSTEICETNCTYENGLKNGLQTLKSYTLGDTGVTIDSMHYSKDKKSGKYSLYQNKDIMTSGYYSIDSNNQEYQSGEWYFYGWKAVHSKNKKEPKTYERYLEQHFVVNDKKNPGKSPIIRSYFIPPTPRHSLGIVDGVYIYNFCGELVTPDKSSDYFDWFYSLNDAGYTYSDLDYEYERSKLLDSLGYIFKYLEYEEYYDNGQLKLKFRTNNGVLERENDTIFWKNGLPMNTINYYPNRKEYEQKWLDSLGNLKDHQVYDSLGEHKKSLMPDKTIRKIIDGKTFVRYNFENYTYGPNRYLDWQTSKLLLLDSLELISATYDEKHATYIEKISFNPQKKSGTIYKEIEPNFAFISATFECDSLFELNNYHEDFTIGDLRVSFDSIDTIKWEEWEFDSKPNYADSTVPYSLFNHVDFGSKKNESVIRFKNKTFTGTLMIHLDAKKQHIEKRRKQIHIYLLQDTDHTPLLSNLLPSYEYYPYLFTKHNFYDTNVVERKMLNFYNCSSIEIPLSDGKINGETVLKNQNNQLLSSIPFKNNKKEGYALLYSGFPFDNLRGSYMHPFYETPPLCLSKSCHYKNGLYDGECIDYNHPSVRSQADTYPIWMGNNNSEASFLDTCNTIKKLSNYSNGKLNGEQLLYFSNGKLDEKNNYRDDMKNGSQFTYDTNGRVLSEFNYLDDQLHGDSYLYYKNETISQRGNYVNGFLKDSLFLYNADGSLKTILIYNGPKFVSGNNYENGTLKDTYINSIDKFKSGIYSRSDSMNVVLDYIYIRNKTHFKTHLDHYTVFTNFIRDSIYFYEFNANGDTTKEGEEYNAKKIGLWKYNLPYQGKFSVHYFDTTLIIYDSIQIKSTGLQIQKDEAGNILSKKYIIDQNSLYNCGQNETYEINTFYVVYERDSSKHLINGSIKNYYPNGVKQSEGINKNGLPQGVWKYYNDNGSLREIGRYTNGKRDGRWLSGDLAQIAYLGDLCLDMDLPNAKEVLQNLETHLRIEETFFENGVKISNHSFELDK